MNLEEFFDYKNLLIGDLCKDEEIVKLVTGKDNPKVPAHDLPYRLIFPYEFIPETVKEGDTFICCDVDIEQVPNKTVYVPALYVWVFTHKSNLRLPNGGGCRIDKLASEINKHINGSWYFGLGEMRLSSAKRFSPITDYLGRVLTYYTRDFLMARKPIDAPSNRKAGK